MAVISRLSSASLLWVQWLSGKSIRLVIGRSRVRFPAGYLGFFFLSKALHHSLHVHKTNKMHMHEEPFTPSDVVMYLTSYGSLEP